MTQKAYKQFLELPAGTMFTATDDWGETDLFIKINEGMFRRTYDNIAWFADTDITQDRWTELRVVTDPPEYFGFLDDAGCWQRAMSDELRLHDYVKEHGDYPDQGFW